ncbi:MAG: family transposase [Firmicutes bacterium]|nr:family transposase [Bacillota bacterium]
MLTADYTNILLDLKDALITNIITTDGNITIFIEQERMPHRCPDCSAKTERVHDYRYQKVKDISIQAKHVVLMLRKRRYVCGTCRKRFLEKIS